MLLTLDVRQGRDLGAELVKTGQVAKFRRAPVRIRRSSIAPRRGSAQGAALMPLRDYVMSMQSSASCDRWSQGCQSQAAQNLYLGRPPRWHHGEEDGQGVP